MNVAVLSLYAVAVAIAISLLSAFAVSSISMLEQEIIEKQAGELKALAVATSEKFSGISSLMTVTSRLPQLSGACCVAETRPELHGVPQGVEVEKREIARQIMAQNRDIEAVAFLLPNGEMYVEEPFERQMNLTRTNFAFRDYFQGAVDNGAAYLGEVYISASSGASTSATAVPVMSKDGQLNGVWIGLLHLQNLGELAKEFGNGQQFVYADQHGHEVVYSNRLSLSLGDSDRPLADMDIYKKAIAGQSGWSIESIGGKEMFVAYQPVQAPSTTWAVFSIQPYDTLVKPVEDLRTTLYSLIVVVSAIGAGIGIAIAKKAG